MASNLKSDFGDFLLGAACLNPKTLTLSFGTNKYYSEYCGDVLRLKSISHVSNKAPFFESYLSNDSITFSSLIYPDLGLTIGVSDDISSTLLQSTNKYISLQSSNSSSSILLRDEARNNSIKLDTNDISTLTNANITNVGDFHLLTSSSIGYLPNFTNIQSNYSSNALTSNFAFNSNITSYASYTTVKSIPVANAADYASYANDSISSNYSSSSSYANSGENVDKASFIAYALTGISASYATVVESGPVAYVNRASYAQSTNNSSPYSAYASAVTFSNYSNYSPYASYALSCTDDRLYGAATFASFSNYSFSSNLASFAAFSPYAYEASRVSNMNYILSATTGDSASYALKAEYTNASYAKTASYASYSMISNNATYALSSTGALNASYANFASYASASYFSNSVSYALNSIKSSYAIETVLSSYAKNAGNAAFAIEASYAVYSSFFYGSPFKLLATYAARAGSASYATSAPRADFATYAPSASYADFLDISDTDAGFTKSLGGPTYTVNWQYFDMATFHKTYSAGYFQYYLYR